MLQLGQHQSIPDQIIASLTNQVLAGQQQQPTAPHQFDPSTQQAQAQAGLGDRLSHISRERDQLNSQILTMLQLQGSAAQFEGGGEAKVDGDRRLPDP